jgi:prophage regulatory protein
MFMNVNITRQDHIGHLLDRILGWPEVHAVVGLSRPQVWRLHRAGDFPAPLKLSKNRRGWKSSEIQSWIDSRERA